MQYGVLTGLFIASYTVVDGYAVKVMLLSPILVDYMGNFVRVLVLAPVALRKPAELAPLWAAQWRFALLVAAVSPVAYVLVLFAMQSAPLSHVAPARRSPCCSRSCWAAICWARATAPRAWQERC